MANNFTTTPAEAGASDTYSTRADIESIYGVDNVETYANLDGDATDGEIADQIAAARQWAYALINSYLRGASLTAPASEDNFSEYALLATIEAELAGVWLYRHRGQGDTDDNRAGKMQVHWDGAIAELNRIIAIADADDGTSTQPGAFQFVTINRGTSCSTDEHASN